MHTRTLLPLLALLPLSATASAAEPRDLVDATAASAPAPRQLDKQQLVGDWTVRADQGGCERKLTVGEDHTINFADGVGLGTWSTHGETLQINAQHANMPTAETGLAAKKRAKVRWNGELRRGPHGSMIGELSIEVLDDAGKPKGTRKAKFTATRS